MSKRKSTAGGPSEAGNAGSEVDTKQARPWTDQEMAAAKPLPLPTTGHIEADGVASVSHAGQGQTAVGGRPENDRASH